MIDLAEFKKFFLFNLIGGLVISALVAVVTVLIGAFNEVTARVLFTLLMVIIHSLVSLAFIWDNEKQNTFERLAFFTNVLFFIIVLSFITSILGIWKVIPLEIVWHLYQTYFVIGFASLHGDILSKALNKENYIDMIIYLNYIFMVIVVLMLLPLIYLDNAMKTLGEIYYRILAAMGIIDGTLSILTIIFYKLFLHKHPKTENPLENSWNQEQKTAKTEKKKGLSIWVWILILYLIAQILFPLVFFGFGRFF
ncbi:hypothetical protein J4466_00425 [Candidatus Pacearchaeota archaeon]|nr:hypothetical protein [Candidatus Pacearchaeota archaeon]